MLELAIQCGVAPSSTMTNEAGMGKNPCSIEIARTVFRLLTLAVLLSPLGCDQSVTTKITASDSGLVPADAENGDVNHTDKASPEYDTGPDDQLGQSQERTRLTRDENPLAIQVPDGTPDELLEFIENLETRELDRSSPELFNQQLLDVMNAQYEAAENILGQRPDENTHVKATIYKLQALRVLASVGPDGTSDIFQKFVNSTKNSSSSHLVLEANTAEFQYLVDQYGNDELSDSTKLKQRFEELAKHPDADFYVLMSGQQAAGVLHSRGETDLAVEILTTISQRFQDAGDEQLAMLASKAGEDAAMIGLQRKFDIALADETGLAWEMLKPDVEQFLASEQPLRTKAVTVLQMAKNMEYADQAEITLGIFDALKKRLETESDSKLTDSILTEIEISETHLKMVGQPLSLEGVLVDGSPFDWNEYQGKVVLVDFWATWCGPCLQELPNIKDVYSQYHEKGFDVVGINLDSNRNQLTQFLSKQRIPWATVVTADPGDAGNDPNSDRYRVRAIPFTALVGRDGNVVAIHVLGETLGEKVKELLVDSEVN